MVYFWGGFAPQCAQIDAILTQMDSSGKYSNSFTFVKVDAEQLSTSAEDFDVETVPAVVFVKNGKIVDRVDGANPPLLNQLVQKHQQPEKSATTGAGANAAPTAEEVNARLKSLVESASVMVFMKGSPAAPQCGFSRRACEILKTHGAKFSHFDILTDNTVREAMRIYSNWPTYPQIYINSEFVGGVDILTELAESGDLKNMLAA